MVMRVLTILILCFGIFSVLLTLRRREDYPVMPAEPMTLLLRSRNFFLKNPALDVPPSYAVTPSQKAGLLGGLKSTDGTDRASVRV